MNTSEALLAFELQKLGPVHQVFIDQLNGLRIVARKQHALPQQRRRVSTLNRLHIQIAL